MRKLILLALLLQQVLLLNAQGKKPVYTFFDSGWVKAANPDKGKFFTRLQAVDDTSWRLDSYDVYGPMIRTETFNDKKQSLRNGKYAAYHPSGYIDSIGQFYQGKPHGDWYYISSTGNYLSQKTYDNGTLVSTYELANGDATRKKDGTPSGIGYTKAPEFEGGNIEWSKYLVRNLRYPGNAMSARIMGTVVVLFTVDVDGKPKDLVPFKSVQTQLDTEAIRLIANSPKWIPAENDGVKIKSIKRQGVVFRTE